MAGNSGIENLRGRPMPFFEQVVIPPDRSFLWRKDDYPTRRAVWNYHPEVEIHLIRYSSGLAYVGDHIGPFVAGDLRIIGSNLPHNWVTSDVGSKCLPERDVVVQFDPATILRGCASFPELKAITRLLERAAQGLMFTEETARIGRAMLEGLEGAPPGRGAVGFLALLQYLASSAEVRTLASQHFVRAVRRSSPEQQLRLEHALAFIQDRFLERPDFEEVADLAGMSPSVFSRFFKRRTGNTFTEHLVSLRISHAQKLLIETEQAITDICYRSGFNNISNFNRTFLRKAGMAPSIYRRAARQRT